MLKNAKLYSYKLFKIKSGTDKKLQNFSDMTSFSFLTVDLLLLDSSPWMFSKVISIAEHCHNYDRSEETYACAFIHAMATAYTSVPYPKSQSHERLIVQPQSGRSRMNIRTFNCHALKGPCDSLPRPSPPPRLSLLVLFKYCLPANTHNQEGCTPLTGVCAHACTGNLVFRDVRT